MEACIEDTEQKDGRSQSPQPSQTTIPALDLQHGLQGVREAAILFEGFFVTAAYLSPNHLTLPIYVITVAPQWIRGL